MSVFEEFEGAARPIYHADAAIAFGLNSRALAQALRNMADEIERGNVLPQSLRQASFAVLDDYPRHSLRIVYVDTKLGDYRKKLNTAKVVELYADDSQFPIDVTVTSGVNP